MLAHVAGLAGRRLARTIVRVWWYIYADAHTARDLSPPRVPGAVDVKP